MAKFCSDCGAELKTKAKFCAECGAGVDGAKEADPTAPQPVADTTQTAATPAPAVATASAPTTTKPPVWWFVAGGLVLVIAIVLGVVLLGGSGTDDSVEPAAAKVTTTTVDPEAARNTEELRQVATRVDGILSQSSAGRGDVASTVARVQNCSIYSYEGSTSMDTVISNRESVLAGIRALPPSTNPTAANVTTLLQNAIQESLQSDYYYRDWMNELNSFYDYCTYRGAYATENFEKANAASGRATAAKDAFVNAYNPVATLYGLRQWGAGEI